MSTRRARIKAVASLPVRRKNIECNDTKKNNPEKSEEISSKPDVVPAPHPVLEKPKETTEAKSPSAKNEAKSVHTPKVRKTPIRTPNLIERVSSTPRSMITSVASPRRSSPLARSISPSLKQSPNVKQTNQNLANTLLQKALHDLKPRHVLSKQNSKEDYNPPSIPESESEDTVLDGIVPLSNHKASSPIDNLKNEIISEYAEVFFDPIVPLPSPGKVRSKLKPAPRLPIRRNSIQGSASESEDEKRAQLGGASTPAPQRTRHDSVASGIQPLAPINRELNRVRNDSVCSVGSQPAPQLPPVSPLREKILFKSRRTEASRRAAAAKRKQRAREDGQRGEMTMYDLIFYNPSTNPIVLDEEDTTVVEAEEPAKTKEVEEKVDDPPPPPADEDAAPVPQLKLGPNGEIILDEKSLVIEQTESTRKLSTSIVHESAWASSGKGRYSRARRTADWAADETVRFYRALAAVGTDFTLMESLFPGRTRRDLKLKFKKEERVNGAQVDKALRSQTHWDGDRLEDVFAVERQETARKRAEEKAAYQEQRRQEKLRLKAAREDGLRPSRAAKAIESTARTRAAPHGLTADAFISRALAERAAPAAVRLADLSTELSSHQTQPLNLSPQAPPFATLTLVTRDNKAGKSTATPDNLAVLTPTTSEMPEVSKNIETGSLVVLTVNDPKNPAKKMLQTYISHGGGKLTPVALPSTLLSSVMGYMKKGTPKSAVSTSSSPQFMSPNSERSQDSRSSVITINPSPNKRSRHNSYNITQL